MAIPSRQRAELRLGVAEHERRIAELRAVIRMAEEEIAVHETLVALSREEPVTAALDGVPVDAQALPEGVTLEDGDAVAGRVTGRVRRGGWEVAVGWDRDGGFFAAPDTTRLRLWQGAIPYVDASRDVPGPAEEPSCPDT